MLFLELLNIGCKTREMRETVKVNYCLSFSSFWFSFPRSLPVFGFVRQVGLFSESPDTGRLHSPPHCSLVVLAHRMCRNGCRFQQDPAEINHMCL